MTIKSDIDRYYDFWFSLDQLYSEWAKKLGLTSNSVFVLYIISENPNHCTQQLICQKLQLPKQTVNSILSEFEAKGYIIKIPSEKDRRSKILRFTEKGKAYADHILSDIYTIEENALYNMSPKQRSDMLDNCEVFYKFLRNEFYKKP